MSAEQYSAEGFCSEGPGALREKINNYPLGEQLLSRIYFAGFSDEVMSELVPNTTKQEVPIEETGVPPFHAAPENLFEDNSWIQRALCPQTDPEAFFPEKGGSTREAKKVCNQCEVRVECLELALKNDERFGIWGGLSERERRKLKKRLV